MHYLAPFPILIGVVGAVLGLMWLVAAGSEQDGGPSVGFFYAFGFWYIGMRICRQLGREPMSVLPAFGILFGSGALIWVGVIML